MDVVKTLLAGCGLLAILGAAGCVGLVGVGSYAVDQAIQEQNEQRMRDLSSRNSSQGRPNDTTFSDDPFSDYSGDEDAGGWGEDTQ